MIKYINAYTRKTLSFIFTVGAHIPKSVAIIMDGNRRFAEKKKVEKIKGHEEGLSKLLNVLEWCLDLGIKEVTVFAFSIDNFNRPKEEFDQLMNLAKEKFSKLSEKNEFLNKHGVRICFYGNLKLCDKEIQQKFEKMEKDTFQNDKIKLNVCFAYNSTEEINSALLKIRNIEPSKETNFKIEDFEKNLYGGYNLNPDILIRTSGEVRLSNFLLYQCRFSILFFVDKYWPEFNFKDFLSILLRYNINYKDDFRKLKELEEKNNFKIINT